MSEKDAQAVQKAQQSAAAKGAEQEKAQQEARELQVKAQQAAAEAGGVAPNSDVLPPESPYQAYDFMPLSDLVALAEERGVTINPDVLKAHLVTELRAHQSGVPSASSRLGAR